MSTFMVVVLLRNINPNGLSFQWSLDHKSKGAVAIEEPPRTTSSKAATAELQTLVFSYIIYSSFTGEPVQFFFLLQH
ncbi:hypothetical protein M5689_002325 [Euphorbia peplus]|nr:hypothetical protein M5689_002325 [Euphorbia peplus]